MKKTDKVKFYEKEYSYINDKNKVKDIKALVGLLPDYYFEIPASSTGKYHPKYAATTSGLVKHTKVAVRIAHELLTNETTGSRFSDNDKDLIIMALILHDGLKSGNPKEQYTRFDHPLLISKFIMENKDKTKLTTDEIRELCNMIETHMGQWTIDPYTKKEILPKPKTELQRLDRKSVV